MNSYFSTFLFLSSIFSIVLIIFIYFFPTTDARDVSQLIENSLLITGLSGLAFTVPLAQKELEKINEENIPKVVHLGNFDFFRDYKASKLASLSATAFNMYGWSVTDEEMKRLVFIDIPEGNDVENNASQQIRGDYIHVWLRKHTSNESKGIIADPNPSKKALGIQDHLLIIYEDSNGNKHYSLMTKSYKYKFGKLNYKEIASALGTETETIKNFEIASRYE